MFVVIVLAPDNTNVKLQLIEIASSNPNFFDDDDVIGNVVDEGPFSDDDDLLLFFFQKQNLA
jgi:hypothetical protein